MFLKGLQVGGDFTALAKIPGALHFAGQLAGENSIDIFAFEGQSHSRKTVETFCVGPDVGGSGRLCILCQIGFQLQFLPAVENVQILVEQRHAGPGVGAVADARAQAP